MSPSGFSQQQLGVAASPTLVMEEVTLEEDDFGPAATLCRENIQGQLELETLVQVVNADSKTDDAVEITGESGERAASEYDQDQTHGGAETEVVASAQVLSLATVNQCREKVAQPRVAMPGTSFTFLNAATTATDEMEAMAVPEHMGEGRVGVTRKLSGSFMLSRRTTRDVGVNTPPPGAKYDKEYNEIATTMKNKILIPHRREINIRIAQFAEKLTSLAVEEGTILDAKVRLEEWEQGFRQNLMEGLVEPLQAIELVRGAPARCGLCGRCSYIVFFQYGCSLTFSPSSWYNPEAEPWPSRAYTGCCSI